MKNVVSILTAFMLLFSFCGFSQEKKHDDNDKKPHVEIIIKKLSLSNEQTQKVRDISAEDKASFEKQLKEILTPAQWTQYEQIGKDKKCCAKKESKNKSCCSMKGKHGKKDKKDKKKSCCKMKKEK